MDIPDDLRVIHQPTRLRILALVCRHRDVGFADVRDHLGLTDGNLGSHTVRLEEAGFLESRRSLGRTGVMVRYRPTSEGDAAMERYRAWLVETLGPPTSAPR